MKTEMGDIRQHPDYQSEMDRKVTQALTTFKEKTLPGLLEQEIQKRTAVDPAEALKKQEERINKKAKIVDMAIERKMPVSLCTKYLLDAEDIDAAFSEFETEFNQAAIARSNESLKSAGIGEPKKTNTPYQLTAADLRRMSPDQVVKALNSGQLSHITGGKR